jgi:hypothetical protein
MSPCYYIDEKVINKMIIFLENQKENTVSSMFQCNMSNESMVFYGNIYKQIDELIKKIIDFPELYIKSSFDFGEETTYKLVTDNVLILNYIKDINTGFVAGNEISIRD